MSAEASAWAYSQPLPPAPKLVLLAIANNADKHGKNCFPSLKTIVENCVPMKLRTVQYHLKWLAEEAKLITITPWFQPSGRQTSNLYELCMTTTYCGEGARSCRGGRVQEVAGGRVQEVAGGRVQEVAPLLNPENLDLRKIEQSPPTPPTGDAGAGLRPAYNAEFEEFWQAYPNKTAKKHAWACWQKARDRPGLVVILHAIDQAKKSERWQRGIIPNPSTWINQGRWADVITLPSPLKPVGPKAMQPVPPANTHGEACPPEVAAKLARLLGRETTFSWPAALECAG